MTQRSPHATVRLRAALAALLAVAVVVEVNVFSARHSAAADWSRGRIYSLSARTVQVLGALDRDVGVTALVSERSDGGAGRLEILRRLLDRYAAASPRLAMKWIDVDRDPVAAALLVAERPALRERVGMPEGRADYLAAPLRTGLDLGLVVESGGRLLVRAMEELFPAPGAGTAETSSAPVAVETVLTAAILEVTSGERPTVCLTAGHGEWNLAGPEGEALLRSGLEADAYEVRTVDPAMLAEELEHCDVTAIVGPSRGFLPREVQALRSALESGAKLLVMLDARGDAAGDATRDLAPLLARAGLEAGAEPVRETDPSRLWQPGSPTLVVGSASGELPATAGLAGRPIVALQAAGLRRSAPGARLWPVAESAESIVAGSWGADPLLGVAAELEEDAKGEGSGRLAVFGASSLLFPPFAERSLSSNLPLVLATIAWLSGREAGPTAATTTAERVRLFLDAGTLRGLWWWLVAAMPVGCAAAGILVLRWRRRGGGRREGGDSPQGR